MSSSCLELTACYVYRGFTASEHEALRLDPNIHLEPSAFPSLSHPRQCSAPSSSISTLHEPNPKLVEISVPHGMCDMHAPTYEPMPTLWTDENGGVDNPDPNIYNAECLAKLAICFPQYLDVIVATDPQDPRGVKKVTNLLWQYAKEERERSWGSTIVAPGATWDNPERNAPRDAGIRRQKRRSRAVGQRKPRRSKSAAQSKKTRKSMRLAKKESRKKKLSALRRR